MSKYKISIILPVYNVEKYIEKSIDSLVKQSIGFDNLQIILIDDNSTDQSTEIIKRYEEKYENVYGIYLNVNSHAAGKPRNEGLNIASGEYIMFLDPDDMYEPDACEILYNEISEGNYDCVAGYYREIDEDENVVNENVYTAMEVSEGVYSIESDLEDVLKFRSGFWAKIYKTDLIEKLKLRFPENVPGQDMVFFIRYLLNCKNFKYVEKPIVDYRVRDKKDKSISFSYNKWFFFGICQSYKMCLTAFEEKNVADKFAILFKGAMDFYIRNMIDSDLQREVIAGILAEWQWAYEYEKLHERTEKDFWYTPVSNLLLNKEYDKAADVICQLRYLREWNNELKEAVEWHKNNNESLQKQNNELKEWSDELKEAVEWHKENSESLQKQVNELKDWVTKVEEARDYYKNQMENIQKEYENQIKEAREYNRDQVENIQKEYEKAVDLNRKQQERIKELEAEIELQNIANQEQIDKNESMEMEIKKWKYKYNRLMSDKTIEKIAKKKNLDI